MTSGKNREKSRFVMTEMEFIEARFDVYTSAYYTQIVVRARNNPNGFFEFQKTTAKNLSISVSKVGQCAALLAHCNIIKIQTIYDPKNPKRILKNKITLVEDVTQWKLDHKFRDAGKFFKFRKNKSRKPNKLPLVSEHRPILSQNIDILPVSTIKPLVSEHIPSSTRSKDNYIKLNKIKLNKINADAPVEKPPAFETKGKRKDRENRIIIDMARDLQKRAVELGMGNRESKVRYFPFESIPSSIVESTIAIYGQEVLKNFFGQMKERGTGLDLNHFNTEFQTFLNKDKIDEAEETRKKEQMLWDSYLNDSTERPDLKLKKFRPMRVVYE